MFAANTPGAAPAGPMNTIAGSVETGGLHLLRLYEQADVRHLPPLYYGPADYSRFSPERPGPLLQLDPSVPRPKVFHLGVIKCL
jgi:hypothetical protein